MTVPIRLRRSFLYVPPAYPQLLDASRAAAADLLCYDLEDATPPAAKRDCRQAIADHLAAGRPAARELLVRVNAIDTEWGYDDLRFAAALGIDGVLVPKVEGEAAVRQARTVLDAAGGDRIAIWCLIETPLAVLRVEQIAAHGVEGLVVGGVDLAEGLGARQTISRLPLWHALSQVVLAARAFGITAIDAARMGSEDEIADGCRQSIDLGFDGKSVASAAVVALVNRLFAPSDEEIANARTALGGTGGYGGHLAHARRVLAYAALARGGTETVTDR